MTRQQSWSALAVLTAVVVLLAVSCSPGARAAHRVVIAGTTNCPALPPGGGTVYLELRVRADEVRVSGRRPVNLSVVLDRSGSMAFQGKIENARAAVRALIDQLRGGDYFSLVIYDDEVDVVCRSSRVTDRESLRRLVDEVVPRGWTNLGGGLTEGIRQAGRHAREDYVNRVILLSDGLANRGITDPRELATLTARAAGRGVSVTTMGVGDDFNEYLMLSLADQGGGNYYFIESPRDLASVFRQEFDLMGGVAVTGAVIDLHLDLDVRVRDVVGYTFRRDGRRCLIPIGDLVGGEERSVIVELEIPAGRGTKRLASGTVTAGPDRVASDFATAVAYAEDQAEVERERDLEVQARADVALSTRAVEEAVAALEEGNEAEAQARLEAARSSLEQSAGAAAPGAAGELLREQQEKLDGYRQSVSDDGRRAKKAIHYDNYKTQKKK